MKKSRSLKQLIGISIANAIVLLLVCYFADNWRFSILTGPSVGQRVEQAREVAGFAEDRVPDDYVFVNTAYDRELVEVYDEYGFPEGEIDITDRGKLATFLSKLEGAHKYVMLDVILSNRFRSESDSLLTAVILEGERIGIAYSSADSLLDKRLQEKAGYTEYSTDIYETNFVKYEFLKDNGPTLPYLAYLSENPDDKIASFGPFHFRNGRLSWRSLTLRMPVKLWNNTRPVEETMMQEKVIYNLGTDILEMGIDIPALVKDKTVVIGDFRENDIHDTYLGKIAGPVININALEALKGNELEIPWWLIATLLAVYTVVTFLAVMPRSYNKLINRRLQKLIPKNKFFRFVLSLAGYTAVFTILAVIIYLSAGIDINVMIPSVWFTLISTVKNYRQDKFKQYVI